MFRAWIATEFSSSSESLRLLFNRFLSSYQSFPFPFSQDLRSLQYYSKHSQEFSQVYSNSLDFTFEVHSKFSKVIDFLTIASTQLSFTLTSFSAYQKQLP